MLKQLFKQTTAFIAAWLLLASIFVFWVSLGILFGPVQWPIIIVSVLYVPARAWSKNIGMGEDVMLNTIFAGHYKSTISGRIGFHSIRGDRVALHMERPVNLIFKLWKNQDNHCRATIKPGDIYNRHLGY